MPQKKVSRTEAAAREELETFTTEYRSLVGRGIVAGLIRPFGGFDSFALKGPDYDQDTGNYNQNGGGDHQQNSGDYTQGP